MNGIDEALKQFLIFVLIIKKKSNKINRKIRR